MKTTIRKRIFAWILKKSDSVNHLVYGGYKGKLLAGIEGVILEIGPGTDINLRYLPAGVRWVGIEPNTAFHDGLLQVAKEKGIAGSLAAGNAMQIPFEDESMDIVLCTLVLCSVANVEKALAEMKRVLKTNGKLFFIEHVAAPAHTYLRFIQNIFNPLNRLMADGCNCNRETWGYLQHAGFRQLELSHHKVKGTLTVHAPHIMGYAIK
jgi:SAM-dependent methyltransferase